MDGKPVSNTSEKPLAGRVALVSGGSRGIGRETVRLLASKGARVAFTFKSNKEAADRVVQELKTTGAEARAYAFDVAESGEARKVCAELDGQWGGVQILVNNAGVTKDNLFIRMTEDEWDEVMRTNLRGAFALTRAVTKGMMKKRWGRIINITSVSGLMGNVGQANYAASKMGLVGFTKSLARELAGRDITVNAVAPGFVETEMTEKLPEKAKETLKQQIPLGRFGRPEEVAEVVCFLASDKASYITGQVVSINGGLYM